MNEAIDTIYCTAASSAALHQYLFVTSATGLMAFHSHAFHQVVSNVSGRTVSYHSSNDVLVSHRSRVSNLFRNLRTNSTPPWYIEESVASSRRAIAAVGRRALFVSWLIVELVGCSSPSRVDAPKWNPKSVGERAVSTLDSNGDDMIDTREIVSAPGLKAAFKSIDANQDNLVSAQEIEARIDGYKEVGVGVAPYVCAVHYCGKPLDGAIVRLIPEEFLGDAISPAVGVSKPTGYCYLKAAKADLPGVYVGMYRVEITCEQVDLPAKYNETTELGVEVCTGIDAGSRAEIDVFDLGTLTNTDHAIVTSSQALQP